MAADATPRVLITGGDGYLGVRVAERYLSRTSNRVVLAVRARDAEELAAKRRRLGRLLVAPAARVGVVGCDLSTGAAFAGVDPGSIRTIIHAAAQTRFGVSQPVAQAVNVDGTERVLAFATRCPNLERFALLSTVYACGLESGRIAEAPYAGESGFANYYEWSKWQAERLLLGRYGSLPWRLLRIATVIADDDSGAVTQYNAFHRTLLLCHRGLLSLLPGDPSTPLYVLTGERAADAVFALTEQTGGPAIYHLTHDAGVACTLGELVAIAFGKFAADPAFRARRVLPPLFCDWTSFSALADAADGFAGPEVRRAVQSVRPFGKQLFAAKQFDTQNLARSLAGLRMSHPRTLIAATCRLLAQNRTARRSPAARDSDVKIAAQEVSM